MALVSFFIGKAQRPGYPLTLLGLHAISQPGRELLCKITELGMFSADFILGHVILFFQLPIILFPYADRIHSTMLFWLRPSRQIRPPIYSSKQSKLRKKRVIRFTVVYFLMLVVFLALVVGPVVASMLSLPAVFETDH